MEGRYGCYKEEESSDSSLENEEYELRECITEKEGNEDEDHEYTKSLKKNNSFINISKNDNSLVLLNLKIDNLYTDNFDQNIKNDKVSNRNKDVNKEKKIFQNLGESFLLKTIYTINNEVKNQNIKNNHSKEKRKNKRINNSEDMKRDKESEINEAFQPGSELIRLEPILKIFKSICKIITDNNGTASGFLIEFPPKYNPFYCLMSNEHVIRRKMIEDGEKIIIQFNNRSESREIDLGNNRIIKEFTNKNEVQSIDATIVEILPADKIDKEYFLEADFDYMDSFNELKSKEIVIVQYPSYEKKDGIIKNRGILGLCVSGGIIEDINKLKLFHTATTYPGSSGSAIFLNGSRKVIGIHAGVKEPDENNINTNFEFRPNRGYLLGPIYKRIKKIIKRRDKIKKNIYNNNGVFGFKNNIFTRRRNNNNKMNKKLNYSGENIKDEESFITNVTEVSGKIMDYSEEFENELFNEKNKIDGYLDGITKKILK